jgi:alkylation response protein AidB-like acyl-CoA dehydrogenase
MDFDFSEEQTMLRDLAREILTQEVSQGLLEKVEAGPDWVSEEVWSKLADANLLGLAVPEELGGMGFGILELCVLLAEVGRAVAPVPAFATLVLGGLPIAEFGSEEQKKRWLEPMVAGKTFLSGAAIDANAAEGAAPAARAARDGDGWTLEGVMRFVPAAHVAARVLVPAATDAGVGLFLVDPESFGVELTRQEITTCEPVFEMTLTNVRVAADDLLGGDAQGGAAKASRMFDCALTALAATQLGVSEKALEITAGYVKQREQFGAPIGSFPAVQHRCADMYIDLSALRWTTWRAAGKIADGQPATREAAVAKIWAGEAGSRIANASQHLHGGAGVDRDYPLHRYFLWSKSIELTLGAAMPQLGRLGRDMARTGPQELQ